MMSEIIEKYNLTHTFKEHIVNCISVFKMLDIFNFFMINAQFLILLEIFENKQQNSKKKNKSLVIDQYF